jgi:cytochrome c-type biogenesis protein CcmH
VQPDGTIGLRLYHKPLVLLIWLGAVVMSFGGALSLPTAVCGWGRRGGLAERQVPRSRRSSGVQRLRLARLAAVAIALARSGRCGPADEILSDPRLEERARHISADLRCLVCQNHRSMIPMHPSPKTCACSSASVSLPARRTRRSAISWSSAYGEFVLLKPVFRLHTALLWLAPVLVLAAGAFGAFRGLRRRRADRPTPLTRRNASALERVLRRGRRLTLRRFHPP